MNNEYPLDYTSLEHIFSIGKIKNDLYIYYGLSNDGDIEITSYSYNGNSERKHVFSRKDLVTLSAIKTLKRYTGEFYLPYLIEIFVGDFELSMGILSLQKYRAEILYHPDYSIATIDYFHT